MCKRDLYSSLFFFSISLFFIAGSFRYPIWDKYGPGPGLFPLVLGVIFSVLSLILFFERLTNHLNRKGTGLVEPDLPSFSDINRVLFCLCFFFFFYFSLNILGYLITVFLFMAFALKLLGKEPLKLSFSISILTSLFVYFLFVNLLGIRLPIGIIQDFIVSYLFYS